MKIKTHRLCTFKFQNNTQISVAVPIADYDPEDPRAYHNLFHLAQKLSWNGNENIGRGGLESFTVGPPIFA